MRRETVITYAATLPACVVVMEACCGAHHMGRALARQGHAIRLMSPEYVRPYVKAQKNDDRDAEAIAEAATRPTTLEVTWRDEQSRILFEGVIMGAWERAGQHCGSHVLA
jgi:transposase